MTKKVLDLGAQKLMEKQELARLYMKFIKNVYLSKKYSNKNLVKYKNIHKGERCFIIATGPSLTLEDIETLKNNNEITFGINSCVKLFDKTNWRPTYYCVTDGRVWNSLKEFIKNEDLNHIFYQKGKVACDIKNSEVMTLEPTADSYQYTRYYKRTHHVLNLFSQKFSKDISKIMFDGYTVIFAVIQLAYYMGFKDIYLLGTDCNFTSGNTYSKIADYANGVPERNANTENILFAGYDSIRKQLEGSNCNIYNATRGGKLEIFKRVNFNYLFNEKKRG